MPRHGTVRVGDVMSTPIETVAPDASVRDAARKMRTKDINALLVTSNPPGIVTSTDILAAVAEGLDVAERRVADVMTPSVETVTPDLHLEEAAAMMTSYDIKHLPVVEDDYIGMISSTDIAAQVS